MDSTQQAVIRNGDLIQVTANGQRWRYRVSERDLANAFVDLKLGDDLRVPDQTQLLQNYPNPFNPETWIPFELAQDADVTITIYNVTGLQDRFGLSTGKKVLQSGSGHLLEWQDRSRGGRIFRHLSSISFMQEITKQHARW